MIELTRRSLLKGGFLGAVGAAVGLSPVATWIILKTSASLVSGLRTLQSADVNRGAVTARAGGYGAISEEASPLLRVSIHSAVLPMACNWKEQASGKLAPARNHRFHPIDVIVNGR